MSWGNRVGVSRRHQPWKENHPGHQTPQPAAPPMIAAFPPNTQGQSHLSFEYSPAAQFSIPNLTPVTTSTPQTNGYGYQQSPHVRQHSGSFSYPYSSPQQPVSSQQSRTHTPAKPDSPLVPIRYYDGRAPSLVFSWSLTSQKPYDCCP